MVKKKGPAQKKRKIVDSGSSAGVKRPATESSERTHSEVPLSQALLSPPKALISPSHAVEEINTAGLRKLVATSAHSEPDVAVTGARPPSLVFPVGVDSAIEDYNHVSGVILKLLQGSMSKYNRATRKVGDLAEDKAKLTKELASASVREEELKKQLAAATSELAAAKEKAAKSEKELLAARSREEDRRHAGRGLSGSGGKDALQQELQCVGLRTDQTGEDSGNRRGTGPSRCRLSQF